MIKAPMRDRSSRTEAALSVGADCQPQQFSRSGDRYGVVLGGPLAYVDMFNMKVRWIQLKDWLNYRRNNELQEN